MADAPPHTNPAPTSSSASTGFLHPERILGYFDIRPGMVVADFGAGGGFFSIAAARLVGEGGKVYAIDIQKQYLDLIKSKANLEHLLHVETVWADLELPKGSRLQNDAVDLVIITNILFQVEKKQDVLNEAWRVVRSGGHCAVLELDETPFPAGPQAFLRVPKKTAKRMAEEAGFQEVKEFEAGSHHYGLLFKKQ